MADRHAALAAVTFFFSWWHSEVGPQPPFGALRKVSGDVDGYNQTRFIGFIDCPLSLWILSIYNDDCRVDLETWLQKCHGLHALRLLGKCFKGDSCVRLCVAQDAQSVDAAVAISLS